MQAQEDNCIDDATDDDGDGGAEMVVERWMDG
jgi:hypothetical protein